MFRRFLTSVLIGAALYAHGMGTIRDAISNSAPVSTTTNVSVITNVVVVESPPVQAPSVTGESLVAAGSFVRPAIAVGTDGAIYVAAEGPKMGSIAQWTSADGKKWVAGKVVVGTMQTAMRTYVPRILPGIVSFRYGPKDGGKIQGPGIIVNGKEIFTGLTTGAARMARAPDGNILMSKNGAWGLIGPSGNIVKKGQYNAGETGEKFDFAIDPQSGMWATCHNGYSKDPSSVSVNGKRQVWADYNTYGKWYGSDLNYPTVCIFSGNVWCASALGGQLRVQMVGKKGLRWPTTALPSLGNANTQDRCPPRLVALQGRLTAFWTYDGQIMRVDVEKCLKGKAKPTVVCAGAFPDINGGYMVYTKSNGVYVRGVRR